MRLMFSGGADEIGASCTLLEIEDVRILIDAGIRMQSGSGESLPDLAAIQAGGRLDAVILTHAHLDHSGALPVLAEAFPAVPIYATPPTAALVKVLLSDAVKIMDNRFASEGELPLYREEAVADMLQRLHTIHYLRKMKITDQCGFRFHNAGHIAGAAMVEIFSGSTTVLVTGDFSCTSQQTVPAATIPNIQPDVLICESTYGNRLHPNRKAEENRLVAMVSDTVQNGGTVLIPAFAVGRAQEVALILRSAMERRKIPLFPVYLDGMVRRVCNVYTRFPRYLVHPLKKRIEKGFPVFASESGPIHNVTDFSQREEILNGPPCCIISSSGMLNGGPSMFYAARLAGDSGNLICITGYQDEESPGNALLALAERKTRKLKLGSDTIEVNASVSQYALSAHIDGFQICEMVEKLRPSRLFLVHGEPDARMKLAADLRKSYHKELFLPYSGQEVDIQRRRRRRKSPKVFGLGLGKELDLEGLERIANLLLSEFPQPESFQLDDILAVWYGTESIPEHAYNTALPLMDKSTAFACDIRRPFLYRPVAEKKRKKTENEPPGTNWNSILKAIGKLFPPEAGLIKAGYRQKEQVVVLRFDFPDMARKRYGDAIQKIKEQSGWEVEIHPESNQNALTRKVRSVLEEKYVFFKTPSIFREKKEVRVFLAELPSEAVMESVRSMFFDETGWMVSFEMKTGVSRARYTRKPDGRMEINSAFAEIRDAFVNQRHKPYKISKKSSEAEDFIELAFITPEIGERYRELIAELQEWTLWHIRIRPFPNTSGVEAVVRQALPSGYSITRGPGFNVVEKTIIVRVTPCMKKTDIHSWQDAVEENTGYRLIISD